MPEKLSTHSGFAAAFRSVLPAGVVLCIAAGPAFAQAPGEANAGFTGIGGAGLGGAVAGGPGLRGTTDALDTDVVPNDQVGQPDANGPVPNGAATPAKKVNLPPLRGTAFPERYPVGLPELGPYPRSARVRKGSGQENLPVEEKVPAPSVAALAVPPRRTIAPDDNPFGPIGYGVGGLRLVPYVEQSFGYDSNPEQVSTGVRSSPFSRTEGGFAIQSDWSAHELKGTVHGGYNDFFDNPRANRPDAVGVLDLRIDETRETQFDAEGRFTIDTQRPGSPELNVAVRDRPLITSFGATTGITQAFGRFSVGLHGLFDRSDYEDGELTDGTRIDLAYQDFNDYGAKAKLGYDLKPGLQPFVEVGYDRRVHDETVDPFGFRRDSDGVGARVGTSFEVWPQLTGTVSAGYADRFYDDRRLGDLAGPTANASIAWAATPLTTLTLQGSTAFNETTVIGSPGIESRAVGVTLSHALFRNLTLTAAVGYEQDDYVDVPITEQTLTASLKAEYHLTRSLVLTGTLSRQQLWSTVKGDGYTQEIALVGLRLQH